MPNQRKSHVRLALLGHWVNDHDVLLPRQTDRCILYWNHKCLILEFFGGRELLPRLGQDQLVDDDLHFGDLTLDLGDKVGLLVRSLLLDGDEGDDRLELQVRHFLRQLGIELRDYLLEILVKLRHRQVRSSQGLVFDLRSILLDLRLGRQLDRRQLDGDLRFRKLDFLHGLDDLLRHDLLLSVGNRSNLVGDGLLDFDR